MPPRLSLECLRECVRVKARQRNVGAKSIDQKRTESEPEAFLQIFRLGESRKIQVRGELFRCRSHAILRVPSLGNTGKPGRSGWNQFSSLKTRREAIVAAIGCLTVVSVMSRRGRRFAALGREAHIWEQNRPA
jgi:hypothetical protein